MPNTSDITPQKLLELYERSVNNLMDPNQCVVWLPAVCEHALELSRELSDLKKSAQKNSSIKDPIT